MKTEPESLERRLAEARMPCPCTDADDSYGPTHSPNCRCKGAGWIYRWPELQKQCPCDERLYKGALPLCTSCLEQTTRDSNILTRRRLEESHGDWCCLCDGREVVPNVTLVTMMMVAARQALEVRSIAAKNGGRIVWICLADNLQPLVKGEGPEETAALLAAMGAGLDWLEAAT